MKEHILSHLSAECPWRDTLHWYTSIDSTNNEAKRLARAGAPHGTVLIAEHQTAGRGRLGRSFSSASGMGVYLSVILRPDCPAPALMHLTCSVAVAVCDAIEQVSGLRPGIKWTNDLVFEKKKLGGILTELSPGSSTVDYAVVGVGINCLQQTKDFSPELQSIATSLSAVTGQPIDPCRLAAAMITALEHMDRSLLTEKEALMEAYKRDCITLGKEVVVIQSGQSCAGTAMDLDDNGGLIVCFSDGSVRTVTSGEVSVRGMYGYI